MSGKRARTGLPQRLDPVATDDAATVALLRDFGHTWMEAERRTNLRSDGVSSDNLKEMRETLQTVRISPDQIALRIFESFEATKAYQQKLDRYTLVMKFVKSMFVESYKKSTRQHVTSEVCEAVGVKSVGDVAM